METSIIEFFGKVGIIIGTLFTGFATSYIMMAYTYHFFVIDQNKKDDDDSEDEGIDISNDEDLENEVFTEEDTLNNYLKLYLTEIEILQQENNSNKLPRKDDETILKEVTPQGTVYLLYNSTDKVFEYYTNESSKITFPVLNTVARKFAWINNAIDTLALPKPIKAAAAEVEAAAAETPEQTVTVNAPKSIFATYKKYKLNSNSNNNNNNLPKEPTPPKITFRYKGKLTDYETDSLRKEGKQQRQDNALSYAEYKLLEESIKSFKAD